MHGVAVANGQIIVIIV